MNRIAEAATSVKLQFATGAGTMASGFAAFVGMIPDDIGKLVSVIGGVASIAVIQQVRKNTKKTEIETKLLQLQLDAAERESAQKRRAEDV